MPKFIELNEKIIREIPYGNGKESVVSGCSDGLKVDGPLAGMDDSLLSDVFGIS